jgi:hypothetical protein
MDELGECIAETVQRQHDEKKAKEIAALESMYPHDFFTLLQGMDTRPGIRRRVSRRSRSSPWRRPTRKEVNQPHNWVRAGWRWRSRRSSIPPDKLTIHQVHNKLTEQQQQEEKLLQKIDRGGHCGGQQTSGPPWWWLW